MSPATQWIFLSLPLLLLFPLYRVLIKICHDSWLLWAPLAWLGLTGLLGFLGFFADYSLPPRIPPFVLLDFAFVLVLVFHKNFQERWSRIPWALLLLPQVFRVPVEIALAQMAEAGLAPLEMSYHGRNFDIVIGLTAPFAYLASRWFPAQRWILYAWNIIGLMVVSNVVIHGMLSVPYPFQLLNLDPPNTGVTIFPAIWLPFFLVPYAYLLHLGSLMKLIREKE